jgi:aerobic-type carbon monoxide dehydrogenase small subunit (CoxS/CutS family)
MDSKLTLTVNGKERTVTTDPRRPLLDVLREDLQLTGAKFGCGEGKCGACTVLVDGERAFSCQAAIGDVAGKAVLTVEGLAKPGEGGHETLHPVQEAFLEEGAFQCGYCTSGMILSTVALLDHKPRPSEAELRSWMNSNVCRCCSHTKILKAVRKAAELHAAQVHAG